MEVTFSAGVLSGAIGIVAPAVRENSSNPALQCLHISVEEGRAVFSGVDTVSGLCLQSVTEPAKVTRPGTALVHGSRLAALLREVSGEESVHISSDSGRVLVKGPRSSFKFNSPGPDEYPELPEFPGTRAAEVEGPRLVELIRRTAFAVATEPSRYAINGIALKIEKSRIELVATDGRRLAVASADVGTDAQMPLVIVPPRVIAEVKRLALQSEKLQIATDSRRIYVQAGSCLLAGLLFEGTFPSYGSMIPKQSKHVLRASLASLASGLRQAAVFTSEMSRVVVFNLSGSSLVLSASSADIGEASIEVPAEYSGPAQKLAFNPFYLLDALNELGDEEVSLELEGPDRPAVMRRPDYTYVVAPVRM